MYEVQGTLTCPPTPPHPTPPHPTPQSRYSKTCVLRERFSVRRHKRPSPILTIFIGGMENTLITFSCLPSGKLSHNYGKSPFLLENPLFLWTLSIVFGMFTRPGISITSHRKKDTVVSTSAGEINGSHHRDIRRRLG